MIGLRFKSYHGKATPPPPSPRPPSQQQQPCWPSSTCIVFRTSGLGPAAVISSSTLTPPSKSHCHSGQPATTSSSVPASGPAVRGSAPVLSKILVHHADAAATFPSRSTPCRPASRRRRPAPGSTTPAHRPTSTSSLWLCAPVIHLPPEMGTPSKTRERTTTMTGSEDHQTNRHRS
jgi:hypothetical protein